MAYYIVMQFVIKCKLLLKNILKLGGKQMKKLLALVLALCMIFALAACGQAAAPAPAATEAPVEEVPVEEAPVEEAPEPVEVIVFAAASMTETLTEVADMYMAANPNVTITMNFDSSGTLKTQIQEGADCDVFISAGQKQMNQLDIEASPDVNTEGLDFVDTPTRVNFLENKVVLVVPESNPKGLSSFDDLADGLKEGTLLFCMGNEDVPVGQYTQQILEYYGLDEAALASAGTITYGSNVKEVTTQVTEAAVDAGVVYCTDAFSAGLSPVAYATKDMCKQIIYPAAVMKNAPQHEAAQAFLDYCFTDEAMAVFTAVGFEKVA